MSTCKALSIFFVATSVVAFAQNTVQTPIYGVSETVLKGGEGSLYAPSFVNPQVLTGPITNAMSGEVSQLDFAFLDNVD